MFTITMHKGFRMSFSNGLSISVQWGPDNYCSRQSHQDPKSGDTPETVSRWRSETAEIAIFEGEEMLDLPGRNDQVIGHLDADDVACLINWVYNKPECMTLEAWQASEPCRIFTRTNF